MSTKLDRERAKTAFEQGRIHPQCPECAHQSVILHRALLANNQLFKSYECNKCHELFIATVLV